MGMRIRLPGDRKLTVSVERPLRLCPRNHRLVRRGSIRICPQCDLMGEPGLQAPEGPPGLRAPEAA